MMRTDMVLGAKVLSPTLRYPWRWRKLGGLFAIYSDRVGDKSDEHGFGQRAVLASWVQDRGSYLLDLAHSPRVSNIGKLFCHAQVFNLPSTAAVVYMLTPACVSSA
jgi:hypothetical protein